MRFASILFQRDPMIFAAALLKANDRGITWTTHPDLSVSGVCVECEALAGTYDRNEVPEAPHPWCNCTQTDNETGEDVTDSLSMFIRATLRKYNQNPHVEHGHFGSGTTDTGLKGNQTIRNVIDLTNGLDGQDAVAKSSGLAQRVVAHIDLNWQASPTDNDPSNLALQQAAAAKYGSTVSEDLASRIASKSDDRDAFSMTFAGTAKNASAFLDAQYATTQSWLADHSVTEVTLFRGVTWNSVTDPTNPLASMAVTAIHTTSNPLTSWSYDAATAEVFANGITSHGVDRGAVVKATVPASSILSVPQTGMASNYWKEVVVITPHDGYPVTKIPSGADYGVSGGTLAGAGAENRRTKQEVPLFDLDGTPHNEAWLRPGSSEKSNDNPHQQHGWFGFGSAGIDSATFAFSQGLSAKEVSNARATAISKGLTFMGATNVSPEIQKIFASHSNGMTQGQIDKAAAWYSENHDVIVARMPNISAEAACSMAAVCSQNTMWGPSSKDTYPTLDMATTIYNASEANVGVEVTSEMTALMDSKGVTHTEPGLYALNDLAPDVAARFVHAGLYAPSAAAIQLYRGEDPNTVITGAKLRSFATNLAYPDNPLAVTADRWVARQALVSPTSGFTANFPKTPGAGPYGQPPTGDTTNTAENFRSSDGGYKILMDNVSYYASHNTLGPNGGSRTLIPSQAQAVPWVREAVPTFN